MTFADTHTHCYYSTDSKTSPEDMIKGAIAKGADVISFTDHMDLDYPYDEVFEFDPAVHFRELDNLREKYKDSIKVMVGIEAGMQPQVADELSAIVNNNDFDIVLGSQHVSNGEDPYHSSAFENKNAGDVYREFFQNMLVNISIFTDFDTLAHLDYCARYGPGAGNDSVYEDNAGVIDEILDFLIKNGRSLEVNTSGLKKGTHDLNPSRRILERYRELGGTELTIGSDAHKPDDIVYSFDKAIRTLKEIGFDHYNYYIKRKPVRVEIS